MQFTALSEMTTWLSFVGHFRKSELLQHIQRKSKYIYIVICERGLKFELLTVCVLLNLAMPNLDVVVSDGKCIVLELGPPATDRPPLARDHSHHCSPLV